MKKNSNDKSGMDRRDFLKVGAMAGLGIAAVGHLSADDTGSRDKQRSQPAPAQLPVAPPMKTVRVGFVGVGGMGSAHVRNYLKIDGVEIKAVCDIVEEKVKRIQEWCKEDGRPIPKGYSRGEHDFLRMCEEEELDLVMTATPWRWHVPICLAAMKNGKHSATEVPAAVTIEECWQLVEAAEKYEKHCVMMENCNYGRSEMLVFNLVRKGLLGEVMHAECGYLHDLRGIKFSPDGEGLWRRDHSWERNGNLYPTHGLGPVAQCMDINRGNQFDYLVSMSSNSRGLQLYAQNNFPPDASQRKETFKLGDVNVSLIKTVQGQTIFLSHDTNLPRPYSRINMVQGTKGLFQGYPDRIHIEGRSPGHKWEDPTAYFEEFDHPLWKNLDRAKAKGAPHGGMDFLEDLRLIYCLRNGLPTDMNVYDAAALSCVSELTEQSVANGSQPVKFPDFTRGRWKEWPQLEFTEKA